MQAMPSSLSRESQVPASFAERRSISHDLARFSLELAPDRRGPPSSKTPFQAPYPSPPMSHSPPPLHPLSPNDPRQRRPRAASNFYEHSGVHLQPNQNQGHDLYRHGGERPLNVPLSAPADAESFPAPFPSMSESMGPASSTGRSPFIPQTSFPPPQPLRRPKSHVASACVNCKKAHLACDTRRPCPRCVGLGKQDTCVDVQHKKRGRPRLRDERSHSFEVSHLQRPAVVSPLTSPTDIPTSFRAGSHRVLKSQPAEPSRFSRRLSLSSRDEVYNHVTPNYFDPRNAQRQVRANFPDPGGAIAYTTTELLVTKSTESLRELLGYVPQELDCVKNLLDIVLHTDRDKVYQLSNRIREERLRKDPNYLPPMTNIFSAIQSVREHEIPAAIQGSRTYSEVLHLQRPNGQYLRIRVRANLARTSVYFVVMVFSLANEMPPPLQLSSNTLPSSYSNQPHVHTPTPQAPLHSPSFLTTTSFTHPFHNESAGPNSPFGPQSVTLPSPLESRPRIMHTDPMFPSLAQYANPLPSPGSSTFSSGRPPPSPAPAKPSPQSVSTPGMVRSNDLQLPPLQLRSPALGAGIDDRARSTGTSSDEPTSSGTPKRERIGVHEVLG